MSALALVIFPLLIGACASSETISYPAPALGRDYSPADRIRVMQARDGRSAGGVHEGSGAVVSRHVVRALGRTHGDVELLTVTDEQEALGASREAEAKYLVVPTIVQWEDRSNLPGQPDEVRIRLALREAAGDTQASVVTFAAESSYFGFVNEPVEELLDQSFDRAVMVLIKAGGPPGYKVRGREFDRPGLREPVPRYRQEDPLQ